MKILQGNGEENLEKIRERLLMIILALNGLVLIITIVLNFLGMPILKYHYLAHVVITLIAVLTFKIPDIFPVILTFMFVEGQGRILWEYQNWARIIFDVIVLLGVVKIFIRNKKIINMAIIPVPLALFILLHFGWYTVEFFNMNTPSFQSALFSIKIYIYPIFLFLALSQLDFETGSKKFNRAIFYVVFILLLELSLNFYQYDLKETSLTTISQYYLKVMKEEAFTGRHFRPFATSFIPGALSMYLYLTAGLIFLWKTTVKGNFLKLVLVLASIHALVICQIRSSLVKYVLVISLIMFGQILFERFRSKKTITSIIFAFIFFAGIQINERILTNDQDTDQAVTRMLTLASPKKLNLTRLNFTEFGESFYSKITAYPFGLGPGSSGAASASNPGGQDQKKIDKAFLWTGDNLLIALILDFGIGAFFYVAMVLYIPIYFSRYILIFFKNKNQKNYKTLLVCFCSIVVIIIGNWGFLGLPYNPESFMFWFFSALGFNTIFQYKKELTANQSN